MRIHKFKKTGFLFRFFAHLLFFLPVSQINSYGQYIDGVQKFSIEEQIQKMGSRKKSWYPFFEGENIRAGLYHLSTGLQDLRNTSKFDEVYYMISGEADLISGDSLHHMSKGSIVFAPAATRPHFRQVRKDATILVLSSLVGPDSLFKGPSCYKLDELQKVRIDSANIWNGLVKAESSILGFYILPKKLNGDSEKYAHKVDEINFIISGSGKFGVEETSLDVGPGDIIFVRRGVHHYFHSLREDLQALIFFGLNSDRKQNGH
jgi:mannose-6-phosphate isomerase-like protein (cupin superfamily)